jgi:tetratricopeptide (TPR) repeat protein
MRTKDSFSFFVAVALSVCAIAGCDPRFDKAVELCKRAREAARCKEFALAIRYSDEALRLEPKYAWVYYDRGAIYGAMGEYDRAIACCTEAVRLRTCDSDGARFCITRAELHEKKGEYGKAIDDCTEAIRLGGGEYEVSLAGCYLRRGEAYKKMGEKWKAEADFSEAKRIGGE